MRALVLHDDAEPRARIETVSTESLPEGDVTVRVSHSSLNYKDGLAITGAGKIVRGAYPFVPGIDAVGTVEHSGSEAWEEGDAVILTGWGTGEDRWGGYAERLRASAEHLVALPAGLSPEDAMTAGTAGFTAMLSVLALERWGVAPRAGEVAVTGATGGVGSFAVALLAAAGHTVVATTGTPARADYLRALGAAAVEDRAGLGAGAARPLERGRWAGAVDSVGGRTLAALLAQLQAHGAVAACGLAGGATLETTVFPFILRGAALLGIDSNTCPRELRQRAWDRLAAAFADGTLDGVERTTIGLGDLPEWGARIVRGETVGRVVVAL